MKFGPIHVDNAVGCVLAHGQQVGTKRISKGTVLTERHLADLRQAAIEHVVVAQLEIDDVPEDEAAARISAALVGNGTTATAAHTGRVNLHAAVNGLLVLDDARLEEINQLSEAVAVSTLPNWDAVQPGRMLATIKIIPFSIPNALVEKIEAIAATTPLLSVKPYQSIRTILIQTELPFSKQTVLDKTVEVTRQRLGSIGASLIGELRVSHSEDVLSASLLHQAVTDVDLLLVIGASAIVDRGDVVPSAVERAGGTIDHFGMPVDPGNLLLLGHLKGKPVIGLPGCARSPKLNGVDWVLRRISIGETPTTSDIRAMGIGGLLTEIAERPVPRVFAEPAVSKSYRVAPLILAAGMSRRMGPANKLLEPVRDAPMLRRVAEEVSNAGLGAPTIVLGFEHDQVKQALHGLPARFVINPSYESGLSTSLKAGIASLDENIDAALICLGDMPRVSTDDVRAVAAAFDPIAGAEIVLPVHKGKRGNPVLFGRRFFSEILEIQGDIGARHLIGAYADKVCEVQREDPGILLDIDTPETLQKYRNREI